MKKAGFIVVVGIALLVLASGAWVADAVRMPGTAVRRRRRGGLGGRHRPPETALGRRRTASVEATTRQFAVWG